MKKLNFKKTKKQKTNTDTISMNRIVKDKKLSKSALILIIGGTIIAIPCIIFALVLGISALQTGSPREGSRFSGDLVNEITKSDVKELESQLSSISNTEKVTVTLSEGQLKVFIDCDDSLSEEKVDKIVTDAFNAVIFKLPIGTYFTKTDTAKMYDLQINVYTSLDSENRVYKFLHKNAAEENYAIDDLANPKDPKIAAELQGIELDTDVEIDEDVEVDDATLIE